MADVLILSFDGADGSTTFTDSSPSPKTVTAVGNAQLKTAQKKYGSAAGYFDGSGDYLSVPATTLALGAGDFTIELWVYPTTVAPSYQGLVEFRNSASGLPLLALKGAALLCYVGSSVISGGTVTANSWQHVALCMSSGVTKLFLDGVQVGSSYTDTNNYGVATSVYIGTSFDGFSLTGYIDDLRIDNGTALYTANFTPPGELVSSSTPDIFGYVLSLFPGRAEALSISYAGHKYGDNTTWSLSCNDTAGFGWVTEDSGSPFFDPAGAIPVTYGVANSNTVARFGATSLFFPASGTNEYYGRLVLPTGCGAIAAYTNFSFEFWINVPAGGGFSQFFAGSGWPDIACTFPSSTWAHFAACRKANILRYYLGGVKFYEALNTAALSITGFGYGLGTNSGHNAFYLDSIGFSNNYAHYDGVGFTPQDVPFYNVPTSVGARLQLDYSVITGEAFGTRITPAEADGQWNKTVLLIPGSGPVGSKNIVDAKGRKLINQADVVYSGAQSRNGDTSLYFNGTSAKLTIEPSRNLDLIDGDFTIELWLRPSTIRASSLIDRGGGLRACFWLQMLADGTISFGFWDSATGTTTTINGPAPVVQDDWSFVSACKFGNDYRVAVNGTGGTIVTTTKVPNRDADRMFQGGGYSGDYRSWDVCLIIGANAEDGAYPGSYYHGFMEDVRITNGFARYGNSALYPTPATAFLPTGSGAEGDHYWSDVALLAHFDEVNGTVSAIREAKGHTLSISGAGAVTENGQYGGAFDQNGFNGASGLTVPYGAEFDLSTGDFTYEAWVSDLGFGEVCSNARGPGSSGWYVSYSGAGNPASTRNGGYLQWTQWDNSSVQDIAVSVLYPFYGERSRWHHIAIVRKGNDITLFVDGVGNTTTITRRPRFSENTIFLTGGGNSSNSSGAFGRFDEIRITRAARYTVDFKVPTAKFPETSFSYGNAIITEFYGFVPGSVKSAATTPATTVTTSYSVTPPLIIGQPSVYGPTFTNTYSALPAVVTGGEGFTGNVGFNETVTVLQTLNHPVVYYFNDEAIAQPVRGIASGWSMTDTASAMLAAVGLADGVVFTASTPPISQVTAPFTEAVNFNSVATGVVGVVVAVNISIHSAADRAWHESVLEGITLSMPRGITSLLTLASDGLAFTDGTNHAAHRVATSGVGLSAAFSNEARFSGSISEDIALHDAPSLTMVLTLTVAEDVALADIPAQQLLFQAIMQEGVRFDSFFSSPTFTAWAMNLRNAAVSQYSGFNYNSFAKMGDRYLGASDQGLFWLDGDTDATRPVNSRITTGILQPNGNKLAGVQSAYLGMRGNGQFVVTVTDEAGGFYNYTLNATDMETSRVVFGRGLRTRYFTFSLESQGQDFDLDNVEFITTDLSRKLQR